MTAALDALIALAALAWLLYMARVVPVAARMLQIEEYEAVRFLRWGAVRAWLAPPAVVAGSAIGVVAFVLAVIAQAQAARVIAAGWLIASLCAAALWRWPAAKKPLVFTSRMRRLLATTALLTAVLALAPALLLATGNWIAAGIVIVAPLSVGPRVAQLLLAVGLLLTAPLEASVRRRYLAAASRTLGQVAPQVVAVAGSYGKTSTKHILAALLQPSACVLPTRQSFNTLMGVTRVINEDLRPEHRLFVVEMDAYAPGEIRAICNLVHPRLAVLTSVGPQHLERFRTMDRLSDALYEVVQALPPDGTAIMHAGDAAVAALAARAAAEQRDVVRYGLRDGTVPLDVRAAVTRCDGTGSSFTWQWPARELQREITIPLLGLHQVLNVTAAMAAVAVLGCDIEAAVTAAAGLRPVEHRLQPLNTGGPVRVIDDSYNANPVGVHNALNVLASMDGGRKILVTPGLVELGSLEDIENRRYGEHAAAVCNEVILMLSRPAVAVHEGLRAAGMTEEHIHQVRTLDQATAVISRVSRPGDIVLFANDLPDTYLPQR